MVCYHSFFIGCFTLIRLTMKYGYVLNSAYVPRFCRGPELYVPALVSGGFGLLGSGLSNEQSGSNVAAQLKAQQEENQKNRDWQTEQAEIARQYNTSERVAQQMFQDSQRILQNSENLSQAKEMASVNAMYNSPVYQSQQLRRAGINPQVYFGQQSSFAGSSQGAASASAGSAPSGGHSPMPSGVGGLSPVQYQPIDLQIPALQQGIASLVKASTSAGVSKAQIEQLVAQSKSLFADARLKDSQKEYQQIMNQFATADFNGRVQKQFAEVALLYQEKVLALLKGQNFEKDSQLKDSQIALNRVLQKLHGEEAFKASFMNQRLETWFTTTMDNLRADTANKNAGAALSSAQAKTENEFREFRRILLENDAWKSAQTVDETISSMRAKLKSAEWLSEAEQAEAQRRLEQLKDISKNKDKNLFFRSLDSFLYFLSSNIGLSASVGASASVKD